VSTIRSGIIVYAPIVIPLSRTAGFVASRLKKNITPFTVRLSVPTVLSMRIDVIVVKSSSSLEKNLN
jgi:hypothetical protein